MPKTQKFKHLLKATKSFYGEKKGTQVAFAIAKKKHWKA